MEISSNSRDDIVPDDIEPKNDEKLFDNDKEDEDSCCFVIVRIGVGVNVI